MQVAWVLLRPLGRQACDRFLRGSSPGIHDAGAAWLSHSSDGVLRAGVGCRAGLGAVYVGWVGIVAGSEAERSHMGRAAGARRV